MEELLELTYSIEQDSVSPSSLLPLYTAINKLFHDGKFDQVNQFLGELNIARTSTLALVGIIRLCNGAKHHLSNWMTVSVCTYYELINRGEDPEVIMQGLTVVTNEAYRLSQATDHIIQLAGISLTDVDPETRRLAEEIVEMEISNPDRRSIGEWADTLVKSMLGP